MMFLRQTILSLVTVLLLTEGAYGGGIGKSMKNFWEGSGGISNYNGVGAYEAQAAGYYTMGSLYARTPVKNTQIGSITLPSMQAGCGGINMHNGAFSFINSEELIRLVKTIATNASGYALQVGMQTLSPMSASITSELQSMLQSVNSRNINSCEMAASLVGGLWPRHTAASQTICSTLANGSGIASDFAQAKHGCYADRAGMHSKISAKDKASYEKLMVEDVNLAWKSLKESGFFNMSKEGEGDTTLAQLFMTLSGTIIIKSNGNTPQYEFISGRASHNDIVQVLMEGGDIKYHKCDKTDKCLNIMREGGSHTIKVDEAFKSKIEKLIFSIVDKIKTDSELSEDEKSFLNNKAQIPIYKILNVYAAYSGAGSLFELPTYTEAIAMQAMFEYLNDILRQVEVASDNLIIASDDHVKRFKDGIRAARRALSERELKTHQSYATLMKLVERTTAIEGILANQLGSPVAESFQWSKNL